MSKNTDSLHYKLFRGLLVGFLLAPIIIGCLMVGSQLFGYRFASNHGTSMEPTLSDGDMFWVRRTPVADITVGDIVSLYSLEQLWIAHRIIHLEHSPHGGYLLETKGDANWLTEVWEISADETVPVVVARIRFGGYAMDYLASTPVRILLSIAMVTLVVVLVQRWRTSYLKKGKD